MYRILVVDDEQHIRWVISRALKKDGYEVLEAGSGEECLDILERVNPHLLILDLKMPGMDGLELLERTKGLNKDLPVLMITAHGTIETAIRAMKAGAYDYITKPFDIDQLKLQVKRALDMGSLVSEVKYLRDRLNSSFQDVRPHTRNLRMLEIYNMVDKVADTDASILLTGESGTGKEVIARLIHNKSSRRHRPFVSVNCAALPENLIESELFGYERGAFTGATSRKPGRFEQAEGGTLLLDEIGELDPSMQVKLLRAIQERAFERLGGTATVKVDVRLLAATNRDLLRAIEEGRFREDLFYRLNVVNIDIPPLRERKEDIPHLVEQFIIKHRRGSKKVSVAPQTIEVLTSYDWPGNIRELENCIERALIICDCEQILPRHLPFAINPPEHNGKAHIAYFPDEGIDLEQTEKEYIRLALQKSGDNKTKAAKLLGITRSALLYRMQKYRIDCE